MSTQLLARDTDEEKVFAYNLLEVALNSGWSLHNGYYHEYDGCWKFSLRRYIRDNRKGVRRSRQTFITETAEGETLLRAMKLCCERAMSEENELHEEDL